MCRLVKGAYWDTEIKRAQEMGLPHYPVFTHKHHTDISYLACARALLAAQDVIFPQFATHNAGTIAAILQMARASGAPFELQRLHGMGEGIYREVLKNPLISCRVYAPVGRHRDLLAYLVRRLLENGANSSFVHQLADESVGMDQLLVSPLRLQSQSSLPLPPELYGPQRTNSMGLDLTVASMRAPLLAAHGAHAGPGDSSVRRAAGATARSTRSAAAWPAWRDTPVAMRAAVLRRAADAMEAADAATCARCWSRKPSRPGATAWPKCARRSTSCATTPTRPSASCSPWRCPDRPARATSCASRARGPWVCISPWNFPLAIFTGQVAAALATGNTVLAKPAEQTPAIAVEAVKLLHGAGVPARCAATAARPRRNRRRGAGGRARASPASSSPARPRSPRSSSARWRPRTAPSFR